MTTRKHYLSVRILPIVLVCLIPLLAVELPATEKSEKRARTGALIKMSQQYLAAGLYDSVMVALDQVRELSPDNPDAFYYEVLTHLALADTARALEVLNVGVERAPLSSRLKLLLARLLLADGKIDDAERVLDTLLRFKPRDPETLYLTGLVGLERGDTTRTLDSWQSALEYLQKKEALK